jgi:MFS family permease
MPTRTSQAGSATDGAGRRWLAWLCLARTGFALNFVAYAAVLPLVSQEWGMSAAQAGLVQSAWHAGFLVSLTLAGFLSDRWGAKHTLLGMSLFACAGVLLFAWYAQDFWSALWLHGLAGLTSGGSYTPGLTLIAERFAPQQRSRGMGWFLAAASLGYGIGLLGSGLLLPLWGWRGALLFCASGTVLATLLSFITLRDTLNVTHAPEHHARPWTAIREVWRNRPAMLSIWAYAAHAWEVLGFWAWLPAFLAAALANQGSISTSSAALALLLSAAGHLVSVPGNVLGGVLADRHGPGRVMLWFSGVSVVCSFVFGWLFAAPVALLALMAVLYNLSAVGDSAIYSSATSALTPAHRLGAAFALRSALGFGMGALSPWVFGLTLDAVAAWDGGRGALPWGLAFCSFGLVGAAAPWAVWKLRRLRPEAMR